ncbi:MAG TPA: GlsB/YeaQ/YmgE family stress response membrane protein [Thermoanaerobaculia bacterium]|nr:GlsB/YeaQ/YmgE family stress response membrane protein [Thermoanaerobaculia bacterium]
MGWIITLIIGGIIGWLASIVMKTNAQMGLIANVVVGVVGAGLGGWLAGVLGIGATGSVMSWIVGIAGAAILIWILKALGVFK